MTSRLDICVDPLLQNVFSGTKFKLFFGNFGEDGSAYYTQNLAIDYWPSIDPVKYKLASEISMLELGSNVEI